MVWGSLKGEQTLKWHWQHWKLRIESHHRTTQITDDTFQEPFLLRPLAPIEEDIIRDLHCLRQKPKSRAPVSHWGGGMTKALCQSIHAHTNTHVLIFANTLINTNSGTILTWFITKAAISPLTIGLDAGQEFPTHKSNIHSKCCETSENSFSHCFLKVKQTEPYNELSQPAPRTNKHG